MKIIFIRSNSISRGPSYDRAAAALSRNNHEVTYLGWDRDYLLNGYSKTEDNGLYTIHRFQMKAPHGSFFLMMYLPFWWIYELYFLIRNKADVIHACDFDTLIPAIMAKVLTGKKLCYTIYDFYADNLPPETPNVFRRVVSIIDRYFIRFTDVVFLVSDAQKCVIEGAKVKKLEVIYNTPEDITNNVQMTTHKNEKFLIFYAGALSSVRGLKLLCKIVSEFDDIKLVLAGSVIAEHDLNDIIEKSNSIEFMGWMKHDEVLKWTLQSDMSIALTTPEIPNFRSASPNKLFAAMMCAKPIVVNSETTAAEIVEDCNCGLAVPYNDENALRSVILKLKTNPQLRETLGNNGRKAYEEKYNWKSMERRLLDSYNKIME